MQLSEEIRASLEKTACDMLYLAQCAFHGRTPEEKYVTVLNPDDLYALCKKHSLTALIAYALRNVWAQVPDGEAQQSRWEEVRQMTVYQRILFDAERQSLLAFCEEQGIWYMPLKGIFLQDCYPEFGLRQMCDNDILFDKAYRKEIAKYFASAGYRASSGGTAKDDIYRKKPFLNFEMHYALVHAGEKEPMKSYYRDPLRFLQPDPDNKFGRRMSDEDFYIYFLFHAYHHYCSGGIGFRTMVDIYAWLRGTAPDEEYLQRELNKLSLRQFAQAANSLAARLMDTDDYPDPSAFTKEERDLWEHCLGSATYGIFSDHIRMKYAELGMETGTSGKKQRWRYLLSRLFPGMEWCKVYAPLMYKYPILMPGFWVVRIFRGVFCSSRRICRELAVIFQQENK